MIVPHEIEILLVEASVSDIDLTLYALRHNAVTNRIHVARDGEEALDFLFCRRGYSGRSFNWPPPLVLLDLKLPKIDGDEVLRMLRRDERTRCIPVVVLTSSRAERDLVESYKLGVKGYIQKPVDFVQFRDAMRHLGLCWLVVNEPSSPTHSAGSHGD